MGPPGLSGGLAFNVKDFGAKGDGVTNDAPPFTAALAAAANGGEIVVPSGTYNIASALSQTITGDISFRGAGSGVTILGFPGGGDGLTFTLGSSAVVHVSGFTMIRAPATGATYGNTGLTLTTTDITVVRQGICEIKDVAFVGGSFYWATGIHIHLLNNVSVNNIMYIAPNATGAGSGEGIRIEGQSASAYLTSARFSNILTQGGSVGLQIGDWVQGVYVDQSDFIGCDYGIRWSGILGDADLWLAITDSHFNAGTRGVFSDSGLSVQIVNTYTLHFPIPSIDNIWAAFEFHNMGPGIISNNSIYCIGSSSPSAQEYAILLTGGNTINIIGNYIQTAKNAGIYVNTTTYTLITGNIAQLPAGIPLVQYASVDPTNKSYGNLFNGALTFSGPWVSAVNDAAAASAGVPVDGVYLNGSAMMVRVA
jgi:hypothetical protein